MTTTHRAAQAAGLALALSLTLSSCGSDDDSASAVPPPSPSATPGSLGADGFATLAADGSAFIVTGGAEADAAHTYTVTDRAELVAGVALFLVRFGTISAPSNHAGFGPAPN